MELPKEPNSGLDVNLILKKYVFHYFGIYFL